MLIPKGDWARNMKDMQPILVYNVICKIMFELFTNRLKKVIPKCISKEQTIFVKTTLFMNVLLANEILRHMKLKSGGKSLEITLKIDINKAYNRVRWEHLETNVETWV